MKALVNCETSGHVRDALRAVGVDAYSCDILPSDQPSPFHIQGDAVEVAYGGGKWDMMIAHPPCTYLCSSGLHWNRRRPGRQEETEKALTFVRELLDAPIEKIALENPIGCISTRIRRFDQIIQPHQFGHDASKATCLWLKNLPLLRPTKNIEPRYSCSCGTVFGFALGKFGCPSCHGEGRVRSIWGNQTASGQNKLGPSADRWKIRSETYSGIAEAMASQWGRL